MNERTRPLRLAPFLLGAFCVLSQGCSHFGYYKYERPERIPPEEGTRIRDPDPDTFQTSNTLDGPTFAALQVAMKDFFPPGAKASGNHERLVQCLSRRDLFDVHVNKVNDDLYLISFSANIARCKEMPPDSVVLDAGATYLIDGQGRILDIR
jgi:hypothetical protein